MSTRALVVSLLLLACREAPGKAAARQAPRRQLATLDTSAGPVLDSLEGPWYVGVPGMVRVTSRGSSSCITAAGAEVQYATPPADTAPAVVRITAYDAPASTATLCTDDWGAHTRLVPITPPRPGFLEFRVYGRPEVRYGHVVPDTLPTAVARVFVLSR